MKSSYARTIKTATSTYTKGDNKTKYQTKPISQTTKTNDTSKYVNRRANPPTNLTKPVSKPISSYTRNNQKIKNQPKPPLINIDISKILSRRINTAKNLSKKDEKPKWQINKKEGDQKKYNRRTIGDTQTKIEIKVDNKPYESITFDVETDLSKPKCPMYCKEIKSILSSIFERGTDYKNHSNNSKYKKVEEEIYKAGERENEPMEILNYNFDTEKTSFYNYGKKSLIRGLMEAYFMHYPITVSPDMILLLFLQGYSRFMEKYSERVRNQYVNFKGRKQLVVKRVGITPEIASKEDWQGIIEELTGQIKSVIGEKIISNLESNFTTTNPVTLTTSQVSIMSAMKKYFIYKVVMSVCGISKITLEGSLEDWEKIKKKLEFFSKEEFGLDWWNKHLIPIIDNIIETKKCSIQNKGIDNKLRSFWKDMIRLKKGRAYEPTVIDGWIVKFIPNLSKSTPMINKSLKDGDIPDQIISCPLKLIFIDANGNKAEYDCSLASGFYGMIQDEKTFNVKPVIGYSIVVEEKHTK